MLDDDEQRKRRSQYNLSDVLELAQVNVTAKRRGDVFYIEAHGQQFPRQEWRLTFSSIRGSHSIIADQSAHDETFTPQDAISILRMSLDTLFGFTSDLDYRAWREEFISNFGHGEGATLQNLITRVETYRGMQRVFGEWFPILLYSEDDI